MKLPANPRARAREARAIIAKTFKFSAAHFLPHVPDGHPCKRMHGHNYTVEVRLEGPISETDGWVLDFQRIKDVVKPLVDELDHRTLNQVCGLENPTAELIAAWFVERLLGLTGGDSRYSYAVRIYETDTCWAEVRSA